MAGLKTAHQGKIAISAKLVLFMFGEQSRIGTRAKSFLGVCVKGLSPLCRHGWIVGMGGVWWIPPCLLGGFLLLFGKQQFPVGNLTPLSITFQKLTDSRSLAKH